MKQKSKNQKSILASEEKKNKKQNAAIISLAIITGVLTLSTIGLGVGLGVSLNSADGYKTELENVYNQNFYNNLKLIYYFPYPYSFTFNFTI